MKFNFQNKNWKNCSNLYPNGWIPISHNIHFEKTINLIFNETPITLVKHDKYVSSKSTYCYLSGYSIDSYLEDLLIFCKIIAYKKQYNFKNIYYTCCENGFIFIWN